jgi:hypothetical protein
MSIQKFKFKQLKNRDLLLLISFMLLSCQPKATIEISRGKYSVIVEDLKIQKAEHVPWKLGRARKHEISKGMRVNLRVPAFSSGDAKEIFAQGVNSWIIKTVKNHNGRKDTLHYGFLPFIVENSIRKNKISASKVSRHFMQISYSGVRVPKRFEHLNCPIIPHRKRIEDWDIKNSYEKGNRLNIQTHLKVRGKVVRSSLEPLELNAGMSILGKYKFYLALYHSHTKTLMSNFVPYSEMVVIESEFDRSVGECANFNPHGSRGAEKEKKSFKWKK